MPNPTPPAPVLAAPATPTAGFTLVEMLVAIVMLAIITLASTGALPALTRVNQSSAQDQRALLLTRSAFEQARQQLELDFDLTNLAVTMSGNGEGDVTCDAPTLLTLRAENIDADPFVEFMLRRVNLRCTLSGKSRDFSVDIARPM
ncbi:PulJ/GspJ family protein [Deinococcus koreensis]|uniref:PulJ/GspJ family protein n=1 Tax=Deinococcus koreensis TaxID=2054903 RepID=UPI0013FD570C|nr:prepilin-type N-terminal cleavage/methylation domain-containing protein [Deinococcus koreensis]